MVKFLYDVQEDCFILFFLFLFFSRTTMVNSLPSSHPFHENVQQLIDALHNHQTRDALRTAVQQSYNPNNYVLPTTRSSRRRNALSGTSDFRRNIYRQNLWVRPQPDVTGRFRESTPEFYRYIIMNVCLWVSLI